MVNQMSDRKKIAIVEYKGSYNIGAFGIATDKYAIVGEGFREKIIEDIKEVLSVPVYVQNIMSEPVVGILLSGNSNGLLVPSTIKDEEFKQLKALFNDIVIEMISFKTYENALGNIILANDKGVILHSEIYKANPKTVEVIEDTLDLEVLHYNFFTPVVRTVVVANNKGAIVHPLMSEDEIKFIKNALKLETIGKGTGNMGSPYVGTSYIVNSFGIVAGLKTTGQEIQRAYEILL